MYITEWPCNLIILICKSVIRSSCKSCSPQCEVTLYSVYQNICPILESCWYQYNQSRDVPLESIFRHGNCNPFKCHSHAGSQPTNRPCRTDVMVPLLNIHHPCAHVSLSGLSQTAVYLVFSRAPLVLANETWGVSPGKKHIQIKTSCSFYFNV